MCIERAGSMGEHRRREAAMSRLPASIHAAALDVHKKTSEVTFRDGAAKVAARSRLDHRDREKLKAKLSRWPKGMDVVLEASFGWGWLSDLMLEVGLNPRLANCKKVEKMRQARDWPKTNKKDADLLSLLPYEPDNWWEVWRAPKEVRDRRELTRCRSGLVRVQTITKNRIQALLCRHGVLHGCSDLFGREGWQFLSELCRESERLSDAGRRALQEQVSLLGHVMQRVDEMTRLLQRELTVTERVKLLQTIPGFGLILSHTVIAEIGMIDRFKSHRHLARYSLVAPLCRDSGDPDEDGEQKAKGRRIGRSGNRTLKWALIEAAHGAVRTGGRFREMYDRYTSGGKRDCNRGYIKVARELAKVVYVVWKKNVPYTPDPPVRPGSDKDTSATRCAAESTSVARRSSTKDRRTFRADRVGARDRDGSRSGMGQLYHPRVAAD